MVTGFSQTFFRRQVVTSYRFNNNNVQRSFFTKNLLLLLYRQQRHYATTTTTIGTSTFALADTNNTDTDTMKVRTYNGNITILERGTNHLVVAKPASVLCHHSDWAGSKQKSSKKKKKTSKKDDDHDRLLRRPPEIPMLQRVRNALGERVNVIHRLDRGCSGCLLFTWSKSHNDLVNATTVLSDALADDSSIKTYVALVRGEGILHGRDFTKEGWFEVTRPIKDEKGELKNATTYFRFLAGQDSLSDPNRPRASLVLARPKTGRWHQIRRHLNGLSHPILGDSSHGNSKTNREWKDRGMPAERTCLHLARLQITANEACPDGIDVSCPLPKDMMDLLEKYLPNVLKEATPALLEENIQLVESDESQQPTVLPYTIHLREYH